MSSEETLSSLLDYYVNFVEDERILPFARDALSSGQMAKSGRMSRFPFSTTEIPDDDLSEVAAAGLTNGAPASQLFPTTGKKQ
jgi:hypothetical protein